MAPYGAKMVGRGRRIQTLRGDLSHHMEALFMFPDVSSIETCFNLMPTNRWHQYVMKRLI